MDKPYKIIGPDTVTTTLSFKEACRAFIEAIKARLNTGKMTLQELETFWWLECPEKIVPLDFYQVRDVCFDNDWLTADGTWIGDTDNGQG